MTTVLYKVARSELISATPILPKIAVKAANTADPSANIRQSKLMRRLCTCIGQNCNRVPGICIAKPIGFCCAIGSRSYHVTGSANIVSRQADWNLCDAVRGDGLRGG